MIFPILFSLPCILDLFKQYITTTPLTIVLNNIKAVVYPRIQVILLHPGLWSTLIHWYTLKSFAVCTGETKSGLAWTHTKHTLNPTNTHTQIFISAEGSKEFNSTCVPTVSQQISRALSQWPDATQSNQQYLKFSLFLLWSFLQESTEYHATLKAKTSINLYKRTHRSVKMTQSAQWAH